MINKNIVIQFIEEFITSRMTKGNIFFPKRIIVNENSITFIKPGFFNTIKKTVYIKNVAEVEIVYSLFGFCKIKVMKNFGGYELSNGFKSEDADKIKSLIDKLINDTDELHK